METADRKVETNAVEVGNGIGLTSATNSAENLLELQGKHNYCQTSDASDQSGLSIQAHGEDIQPQKSLQQPDLCYHGEADAFDQSDICINTESLTLNDSLKSRLINHVAKSDAHFKHQQRGEPDLTYQEKCKIVEDVLSQNASVFLSRFGKYLQLDDLQYFDKMNDSYEVDFYLNEIRKQKSMFYCKNRVKNRRYEALKKMTSEGTYFSNEEMKFRDPYLFEQMVGQYQTDEEIADLVDKSDLRLSSILMKHMQQQEENYLYYQQRQKEESQQEEEEESEEEEEEEMEEENPAEKAKHAVSDERRQELREEFLRIMQERFLSGEDREFNYRGVDENTEYDDLDQLDKDEEEKYFNLDDDDALNISDL